MIVMKFGGTSVADCAAISRTIEIIRKRLPERPVVVVSAQGENPVFRITKKVCAFE